MNYNSDERKEKLEARILSSKGSGLFDYELLEFTIYSACKEKSKEVAQRLMELFNSIGGVINADPYELKSVAGMNDAAIASITNMKEAFDRTLKGKLKLPIFYQKEEIIEYLKIKMRWLRKESLRVLYFDLSNRLVHEYENIGTVNRVPFYIREITKRGLVVEATSALIAHNHPDENPEPSEEDKSNTLKLESQFCSMKIKLIDHII